MKYTSFFSYSYQEFLKPILFSFDPEHVHDTFIFLGNTISKSDLLKKLTRITLHYQNKKLTQNIKGITFENPVGLSAGFDKDAKLVNILADVGFGFHQVGTVTFNPYDGNPKPRLYRLPKSKGISVYYGLKNIGAKKIVDKLINHNPQIPMSISIGKTNQPYTKTTKAGVLDYFNCMKCFTDNNIGDFYTLNISCPNTFGGEPFTTPNELELLLSEIKKIKTKKPIFIKMPINLVWSDFRKLLDIAVKHKIDGVIIGNLNKDKSDISIKDIIPNHVKGGISGLPTKILSNRLISNTYKLYGDKLIIIGVGGIFNADDAYEKIKRGASLVQIVTGLVYQGPQVVGEINKGIIALLEQDGYKNISEAIGTYHSS